MDPLTTTEALAAAHQWVHALFVKLLKACPRGTSMPSTDFSLQAPSLSPSSQVHAQDAVGLRDTPTLIIRARAHSEEEEEDHPRPQRSDGIQMGLTPLVFLSTQHQSCKTLGWGVRGVGSERKSQWAKRHNVVGQDKRQALQ